MLAQSAAAPFDSPAHLFEIKWDGTRCVAFVESGHVRLQNRRFVELRERYPELGCLAALPSGTVLDTEIVVLAGGKPSFNKLAQRDHLTDAQQIAMAAQRLPATMMAFDLLYLRGEPLLARPLTERKARLRELLPGMAPHVLASDHVIEQGVAYFRAAEQHGLEGVMAKRLDSPYLPGKRTAHWTKVKVARVEDFDVIGYTKRDGADVISALLLAERRGRSWVFKGNVGSGFTEWQRAELFQRLSPAPPLPAPPKDGPAGALWRATGLRCTVQYFEKTVHGRLRGPVYKGLASP